MRGGDGSVDGGDVSGGRDHVCKIEGDGREGKEL